MAGHIGRHSPALYELNGPTNGLLKRTKPKSFAEMGVKTRYGSYFFANIDDLMRADCGQDGWDAAWWDYTGQTTLKQMDLIKWFYEEYVSNVLILTTMKSRWHRSTSDAILSECVSGWR